MKDEEKAFYWKCHYCGKRLNSGDEAIFVYDTLMSGNTPVHHKSKAFHRQCYQNWFDEKGNWLLETIRREAT